MIISIYGVVWSGLHGREAKLFGKLLLNLHLQCCQDFDMAEYHVGDTSLIIQAHKHIYV